MIKKPPLLWIINFLLAILGVASVGISEEKKLDFNKCCPVPAIALKKECSVTLGLSVLLSRDANCPKAGYDGFQSLVQKRSDLSFLLIV